MYVVKYIKKKTLIVEDDTSWYRAFKRYKELFLSFEIFHRHLKMSEIGGKV